jgi:predicted transcriptional regulator
MADARVVLLSVRAEWARAILDGRKAYEYRRRPPAADPPYRTVLYATGGPSEVWGEAVVDGVVTGDVETVVDRTVEETPHTPADVHAYFEGSTAPATALRLVDEAAYPRPVGRERLEALLGGFHPPHNFRYLTAAEYGRVETAGRGEG